MDVICITRSADLLLYKRDWWRCIFILGFVLDWVSLGVSSKDGIKLLIGI